MTVLERLLAALAEEPDPPTTIRAVSEAADRHVADSLAGLEVAALRQASAIVDLGSGAGFPGLALAAALPHSHVDLLEASRRKCAVIERLIGVGGLRNARALARRAEEWGASDGGGTYAAVTARALASLPVLVEYAAPLLQHGGVLVAWKGARTPEEERAGESAGSQVGLALSEIRAVTPFADARSRHLYVYSKVAATPERFPRRPGMAVKRPLG